MKKHKKENVGLNKPRRNVLKMIWMGLGCIALAEFIAVCISFFRPKKIHMVTKNADQIVDAGQADEFNPGSVTTFVRGKFYLVHIKTGGFLAISSKCTHLGCTVPWDKDNQKFVCPCHSSKFDIKGKVLSSPAPRAMDIFKITITNNRIFVDTGKRIKRNNFKEEQLVYPDIIKIKNAES